MTAVVVLNATYEPIHTTTVRHAFDMIWRGVAVAVEEGPEMFGPIPVPRVLKLLRYVKTAWMYTKRKGKARYAEGIKVTWENWADPVPPCTTDSILERDHGRCCYCGEYNATTAEHLVPKSQGGEWSWANLLACCSPCNGHRGHTPLEELGWEPLWRPWVPNRFDLEVGRRALDRRRAEAQLAR